MRSPNSLVAELSERFEKAESDFHRAYWDSQVEAAPQNEQRRAEAELEVRRLKGDPAAFAAIGVALEEEEVHDPLVKRQLEILRLSLTANQMDEADRSEIVELATKVEGEFAAFRAAVGEKQLSDNEIDAILKDSDDDRQRSAVWRASKQIGGRVSGQIRELARVRNKVARDVGFSDYYRMSLELQELPEEWLFQTLEELERVTQEPFDAYKDQLDTKLRARFGVTDLRPWHYADPFFQQLPPDGRVSIDHLFEDSTARELARRTFQGWGIDITKVLGSSDLYPRERKSQHAFCIDIDRSGDDVRILANVVPGERWVETMLHESGHAAYDISIDRNLPWPLRRAAHIFVTEAIAIMCGSLVHSPEWIARVAGVESKEVDALSPGLLAAQSAQRVLFARWGLVMCYFERGLYSDPESDLDVRWWELVERFQGLVPPEDPPEDAWAAKIHLAAAPVYYQNYLLGDLLAAQLRAAIEEHCGGLVDSKDAGELLVERIFRHGQLVRWNGLIEAATGEALSTRAFAASLNA